MSKRCKVCGMNNCTCEESCVMRCVDLRLENKKFGRGLRNKRRLLIVASSRRYDPIDLADDLVDACLFRVRIPRSFRKRAGIEFVGYQDVRNLIAGIKTIKRKPALDPNYVHPKKLVKIRFSGYWQIVAIPSKPALSEVEKAAIEVVSASDAAGRLSPQTLDEYQASCQHDRAVEVLREALRKRGAL